MIPYLMPPLISGLALASQLRVGKGFAQLAQRASKLGQRLGLTGQAGQAMTEYAIMSVAMLATGIVASPFVMKFAPEMLNALQIYTDGFYFALALPFP